MPVDPTEDKGALHIRLSGRLALLLSIGLGAFAMSGINPILPAISAHFADNPHAGTISRLMVTIVGVAIAISAPIVGIVADRLGSRRLLLAGLLTYGVAGSAGYLLDDIYLLLAARVMTGVAAATIGATVFAIVANHSDGPARNRWIGYISTASAFSVSALMPVVSLLATIGWREVFLIHAIALVLFFVATFGLEPDRAMRSRTEKEPAGEAPVGPVPYRLLAMTVASGIIAMTPLLYVPFRMKDLGLGAEYIGIAMIPVTFMSAAASFSYGRVSGHLSITGIFVLSFCLLAAGILGNAFAASFGQILMAQVLLGAGEGLIFVNQYALAAQTARPSQRARMMGFTKGGLCAGPMLGQIVLEPVMTRSGAAAALTLLGAIAILFMLVHAWRLRQQRPAILPAE